MARFGKIALVVIAAALAAALAAAYFARGPTGPSRLKPLPQAPLPQASPPAGEPELVLDATVVRIIDGDGIAVELASGPMKVRLHGADAPELSQPFGREAKAALADRLKEGAAVELLPIEHDKYDKYDRMIAVVYADGASLNETLIEAGMAWAYRDYLGQLAGDEHYCELEAEARSAGRGLWSQPVELLVPPWTYRHRQDSPPGAKVPSRDYSQETAADCIAAIRESRLKPLPQEPVPENPNCRIKGNINSKGVKIYHAPGDPNYEATRIDLSRGERWFCTEAAARAAGWRAPR